MIFNMPMKFRLPLMTPIRSDGMDPKRELLGCVVNKLDSKLDSIFLIVPLVYLQCSDSRGIVNCSVLVASYSSAPIRRQIQDFHAHLYMMAGHLLRIATGMELTATNCVRQPSSSVSDQNSVCA